MKKLNFLENLTYYKSKYKPFFQKSKYVYDRLNKVNKLKLKRYKRTIKLNKKMRKFRTKIKFLYFRLRKYKRKFRKMNRFFQKRRTK
jgi:hypothetical protein